MKIVVCQFGNETNTFAGGLLDFSMLVPHGWIRGGEVEEKFFGTSTFLGGALQAISDEGETALPIDLLTNNGNFGPGPLMSGECAAYAMDNICRQLAELKGEYDGIYFALHGAGACELDEDLEGYTLRRIRETVGREMPVMCSMDLHANLTEEMVELADGLFSIKEVPHTDCYDAAYKAAKTLIETIRGEKKPVMAMRRLPMLVSPVSDSTLSGTGKEIRDYFEEYCAAHGLLDCSFVHGFSASDRACSSASVLVVADGRVPDAEADELAAYVWERHEKFAAPHMPDAAEAIDIALSLVKDGYVVINEASDNPGSGGPGDATHLLREMLRRDLPRTIMGPIFDPEVAAMLHEHRVGDRVSMVLGGRKEPLAGAPLELDDVEIVNLSDGNFVSAAPINKGMPMTYGKSARVRKGNVEFIVVSVRFQVYDDRPFMMVGADLSQYDIVGLKSMNHFRGYFASRADAIVTPDTPGIRPADVRLFEYQHVIRPIFPLDEDVEFDGCWPRKK